MPEPTPHSAPQASRWPEPPVCEACQRGEHELCVWELWDAACSCEVVR